MRKSFPVSLTGPYARATCPKAVPWGLVAPWAANAQATFGQPLEVLAGNGGLTPCALWSLLHGKMILPSIAPDVPQRMVAWLNGLVEGWLAAGGPPAGDPEPRAVLVENHGFEEVVRVGKTTVTLPED